MVETILVLSDRTVNGVAASIQAQSNDTRSAVRVAGIRVWSHRKRQVGGVEGHAYYSKAGPGRNYGVEYPTHSQVTQSRCRIRPHLQPRRRG